MPIEKTCPRCSKKHRKRGPYCSRSCGNVRVHTEEDKRIRSKKLLEYQDTPEGVATREKSARITSARMRGETWSSVSPEEFAVDIPDVTDYSVEFDDRWNKAEDW